MIEDGSPLVADVLQRLADGIRRELTERDETDLARQVAALRVVQPCLCGDDFCQSFYTVEHEPGTPWPRERHRTVPLFPDGVMVNLDVVDDLIVYVEVIV